jgi:hypothetical protein
MPVVGPVQKRLREQPPTQATEKESQHERF